MRPHIPGRRVASSAQDDDGSLKASDVAMRRVFRGLLGVIALCCGFVAAAPAGDSLDAKLDTKLGAIGKPFNAADQKPVNFFLDIASTRLVEEVKSTDKRRLNLGGVPVVVGALRQSGAPSVTAGIAGRYDWKLDHKWSMQAKGSISRAQAIQSADPATARAGGEMTLAFAADGTRLQLRPSFYFGLREDDPSQVDLGLDASLRQQLAEGLDLTAAAGRGWHDDLLFDADDRDVEFARVGLRLDLAPWSLPRGNELEASYQVDGREGTLASQFRMTETMVLLVRLAVLEGWRLTGRYAFSAIRRGYDDAQAEARREDSRHRLSIESDWNLGLEFGASWHLKANYGFEQDEFEAAENQPAMHRAMLSFALDF